MNLRVRDTLNFFEDFMLSGEEVINVELQHITAGSKLKRVKLSLNVKEYPNYQKSAAEPNVQEYNIVAVSKFGYSSMLQRISRSTKGNPIANIESILKNDLGVKAKRTGLCVSSFDGIITIQTPLKAIEWLRSKSFDVTGSPFFVYSSISEPDVLITPLSDLWSKSNKSYRKYEYRQFIANASKSVDAYNENALRILDMKSNIKMDKLNQAVNGGFASRTNVTDLATKSYAERIFDVTKDNKTARLNPDKNLFSSFKNMLSPTKGGGPKSFNEFTSASISNVSTNAGTNYQGNPNSTSGPVQDNISKAKSYYANFEAISHQIVVYGDFDLNPGRRITIEIPKSVNQGDYAGASGDELDRSMSGDYIVAVVAHSFTNGVYTSKVKIIKDA
jgi:hypothetical protein